MGLVELYISSFIAAKWHEPSRMEFDSDSSRDSDSEIGRDDDLSDDGDMSASSPSSRSPASSSSHPMDQASDSDGTLRGDGSAQADDFDPTLFMQEPLPYVAPTRPSSGGAAGAFVAEPIFSCAPPIRRAAASYNLECRRYDPAFMDAAMHGKFDDEIFIDYFMTDIDANLLRNVFACDVQLGARGRRTRRQKRQRRRHFRPRPCFRARVTQRTTAPATAPALRAAYRLDVCLTTNRFRRIFNAKTRRPPAPPGGRGGRRGAQPTRELLSAEYIYVAMGPMSVALYSKGVLENTFLHTRSALKEAIAVRTHAMLAPMP
jgi:hypothetical protein